MEVTIYSNVNFDPVAVVDQYTSLIWVERYSGWGDFELYLPAKTEWFSIFKDGYYASIPDSDRLMVVEDVQTEMDSEGVDYLIVTGRSLESLLDRRIVWKPTTFDGKFKAFIKKLLDENAIEPLDPARIIPNLKYVSNTIGLNPDVLVQTRGDNLYEIIQNTCQAYDVGFVIRCVMPRQQYDHLTGVSGSTESELLDASGTRLITSSVGPFEFLLYTGNDHSYSQSENLFVVFSPNMDNLLNNNYKESIVGIKNVGLVAGEGDGINRRTVVITDGSTKKKGLNRKEMYIEANDIQSDTDNGKLSNGAYNKLLTQRGQEKLAEASGSTTYEYELEPSQTYVYGQDYELGDFVQIVNEYGIEARTRIVEIRRTYDENGYTITPIVGNVNSSTSVTTSSAPDSESSFNGSIGSQLLGLRRDVDKAYDAAVRADEYARMAGMSAESAKLAADTAWDFADSANEAAIVANEAANSSLIQLSVVEDVVDTLTWIAEHGYYQLTEDEEIIGSKTYYTLEATAVENPQPDPEYGMAKYYELQNDVYVKTSDTEVVSGKTYYTVVGFPVVDLNEEDLSTYYELNIDDAVCSYVSSHLALTDAGLYVVKDDNGYKLLLSNTGMTVFDPYGTPMVTYGSNGTMFSSRKRFYIGDNDTYILFEPGQTISDPGRIVLSDNVTIGSTKTLSELLTEAELQSDVTIYATSIDWDAGTATLTAVLRLNGILHTQGVTYAWSKGDSMTPIAEATSSILHVTDLDDIYNCKVSWT